MAAAGEESFQRLVGQEAGWFPHSDKSDVFFTDSVQETGSEEGLHRHARHKKAKHPESEASPTRARSVVRGRSHTVKLPSDQKNMEWEGLMNFAHVSKMKVKVETHASPGWDDDLRP